MGKSVIAWSLAGIVLATAAQAQTAPPTPVPDLMPFDIPYGRSITVKEAMLAVEKVIDQATQRPRNWKLSIAVVDPNGDLVYFWKMDQAGLGSTTIAQNKARTAARYRRSTEVLFNAMQTPAGAFLATLDSPPPTASPGGLPLIDAGKIIGAIGCSGATGAQDAVACQAGVSFFVP